MKQRNRHQAVLVLLIVCMIGVFAIGLQAQTEESSVSPPNAPVEQKLTFFTLLKAGGWTMWPLGLCSLLGIGLIIYNGIAIRPDKLLRPDVVSEIRTALEEVDIDRARNACMANPCPVSNIVNAGLQRVKGDELHIGSVEKGMEESSVEEIAAHLQPINYLSVIATISPMLGLLGTVTGMIKAFRAMALGGMGRPELLADNISEALITTATGLIIGIPIMVAYFYFKNRYTSIISSVNRICGDLLETLHVVYRRGSAS